MITTVLKEIFLPLVQYLSDAVLSSKSDCIALSGGLDSAILAYYLKKNAKAIVVTTKDFPAPDLMYSQLVAKEFGLKLVIKSVTIDEIISAIEETIKILKIFNHIEIRNSIVMYIALKTAKEHGCNKIITGDGGDELFAGYSFFLRKEGHELQKDLERIWKIMHFPTQKIGRELGISVSTPFLDDKVSEYAKSLPADLKVREENGKKYGKWVLRKAFENLLPKSVVWRDKSAMQDGSGTSGLTSFFEEMIGDSMFESKTKSYFEKDKVRLKTKESLYYYEVYRRYYEPPFVSSSTESRCPDCQNDVEVSSHFCRMCGSFPI